MILDELPPALDVFTHQHAKKPLGFAGFLQRHAKEHPAARIERRFPELLAVHLAKAFEALDLDARLSQRQDRRKDLRHAGDIMRFVVAEKGVFCRQLLTADGFFLREVVILDR